MLPQAPRILTMPHRSWLIAACRCRTRPRLIVLASYGRQNDLWILQRPQRNNACLRKTLLRAHGTAPGAACSQLDGRRSATDRQWRLRQRLVRLECVRRAWNDIDMGPLRLRRRFVRLGAVYERPDDRGRGNDKPDPVCGTAQARTLRRLCEWLPAGRSSARQPLREQHSAHTHHRLPGPWRRAWLPATRHHWFLVARKHEHRNRCHRCACGRVDRGAHGHPENARRRQHPGLYRR